MRIRPTLVVATLLAGGCNGSGASSTPQADAAPHPEASTGDASKAPHDAGRDSASDARAPTDSGSPADSCAPLPGSGSATIHMIGRFDTSDPAGPKFAWPGSTIVATFTGTGITAQLDDNVGNNYFVVVIDGGAPTDFPTMGGTSTYPLASGLTSGTHTVSLIKRTESYDGIVQLLALSPIGGALVSSPEPWARRIEYIGDSITCGYGVLGGACTNPSVQEEDWTLTAGALVASELHAEPTTIAYSGIGMYRDYSGDTTNQMPTRFLLTLADIPTSTWGFTTPPPAVVVIDLGTNDFAMGDPGTAYQTAYTTFIQMELRAHYPDAYVIVANSPMLSGTSRTQNATYLTNVVSTLNAAGDKRVVYFEYDLETSMGCQYHPDAATDQAMAAKILPVIEHLTGWCP
jgi:lysophospholipase L1-like esterase